MRKATIISIALIFTLILSTASTFAAAWQKDPTDPNNPTITISYKELDDGYEMKMYPDGIYDGKLDMNGSVYDLASVYKVDRKIDDHNFFVCWFSADDDLYEGKVIGESSPGAIDYESIAGSDGLGSDAVAPVIEKVWTTTIELVPTDKRPAKSQITAKKIRKKVSTKITEKAYYVKGERVSKKAYNKTKKTGKYKVKKAKIRIRSTIKLVKTKKVFTDAEFAYKYAPAEVSGSDGLVVYADPMVAESYNFRLDRYYKVMRTYKVKYNLVRK